MGDALPIGAIALATAACPTGYTRVSATDGRYLVSNATHNAAAGGSASHSHANLSSHTHSISITTATTDTLGNNAQANSGSGAGARNWVHSHTVSGTNAGAVISISAQTVDPSFATVILCKRTS